MLPAEPMEQHLSRLRRAIGTTEEMLADEARVLALGVDAVDAALGGGLPCAALHELSATPIHLGAAAGFALALAALSPKAQHILWIATDFGMLETGTLYGPGLDLLGLDTERKDTRLVCERFLACCDSAAQAREVLLHRLGREHGGCSFMICSINSRRNDESSEPVSH